MAATNKFKVFAESSSNVYNDDAYSSNSERSNGSQANTVISSQLMNTAHKTASLISVALVDALISMAGAGASGDVGLGDTRAQLATKFTNILTPAIMSLKSTAVGSSSTDDTLATSRAVYNAVNNDDLVHTKFSSTTGTETTNVFSSTLANNPQVSEETWYIVYAYVNGAYVNFGPVYMPYGAGQNKEIKRLTCSDGNTYMLYGASQGQGTFKLTLRNVNASSTCIAANGICQELQ